MFKIYEYFHKIHALFNYHNYIDINNDMLDYPFPIDNETDLTIFEDELLRGLTFKINLVNIFNSTSILR